MLFQKTEDEGLDVRMSIVETGATGRAEEVEKGEAIFGFAALGWIGKEAGADGEFGGIVAVIDFGN